MYIKYLDNIHNIENYYSIVKGGAVKNCCINIVKHDGNYLSLEFQTTEARNFIMTEIWKELVKETKCYDIDSVIEIYYNTRKYNV